MQQQYKAMRQALFTFLTAFVDIDVLLQQYKDVPSPTLDEESSLALIALVARGRSLFQSATTHARKILHDQAELPIIDAFKLHPYNKLIDTFSMPLLPIVPHQDTYHSFSFM